MDEAQFLQKGLSISIDYFSEYKSLAWLAHKMLIRGHSRLVDSSLCQEVETLSSGSWEALKTFMEKRGLAGLERSSGASVKDELEYWKFGGKKEAKEASTWAL